MSRVLYPVHLLALVPTLCELLLACATGCGESAINLAPVSSSTRKLKREGGGESRERVGKDHGTRDSGQHGSSVHVARLCLVGNGTEKSRRLHRREKYRYRICLPFQEARKLFKYYYRSTVYLTAVTAGTKQKGREKEEMYQSGMVGARPRPAHSHVLQWSGIDAIRLTSDNTDHGSLHG